MAEHAKSETAPPKVTLSSRAGTGKTVDERIVEDAVEARAKAAAAARRKGAAP